MVFDELQVHCVRRVVIHTTNISHNDDSRCKNINLIYFPFKEEESTQKDVQKR